jgi:hypothetical protein
LYSSPMFLEASGDDMNIPPPGLNANFSPMRV